MSYESPLKMFRDQYKNPDLYDGGFPEKREIEEMLAEDEIERKKKIENGEDAPELPNSENKLEITSPTGRAFKETVDLVRGVSLKPEFAADEAETKVLEERKAAVIGMLSNVLDDVSNYLSGISYMMKMRKTEEVDADKFLEKQIEAEVSRKRYHNKLISDIKIAARLINVSFNRDYPEDLRLQEEAKFPVRKGMSVAQLKEALAKHEYYEFPHAAGGFINFQEVPRDPYAERKYIAAWGMKIYNDLTAIQSSSRRPLETEKKVD